MKGYIIPGSRICVDYWEDDIQDYFRFLTHAHDNRIEGIDNACNFEIYTSCFTAWYLKDVLEMRSVKCVELSFGPTYSIEDESSNSYQFSVTLIDSNHCPGSAMFLFQGDFGTVLCTGDFRYTPTMFDNPVLKKVADKKLLDVLNFDNKFINEHCNFPSQEKAKKRVLNVIKKYPVHRIEICVGKLGKILLLKYLAENLQQRICVSDHFMAIATKLGWSELFTANENITKLFALETDTVDLKSVYLKQKKYGPVKILVLTPIYSTTRNFGKKQFQSYFRAGIIIIPYSDHSNHEELVTFIKRLQPKTLVPIFYPVSNSDLPDTFEGISNNIIIPQSVSKMIESRNFNLSSEDSMSSDSFLSCKETLRVKKKTSIDSISSEDSSHEDVGSSLEEPTSSRGSKVVKEVSNLNIEQIRENSSDEDCNMPLASVQSNLLRTHFQKDISKGTLNRESLFIENDSMNLESSDDSSSYKTQKQIKKLEKRKLTDSSETIFQEEQNTRRIEIGNKRIEGAESNISGTNVELDHITLASSETGSNPSPKSISLLRDTPINSPSTVFQNKLTCFCSSQPTESNDKINFWINGGVTGAIFKDSSVLSHFKNSL